MKLHQDGVYLGVNFRGFVDTKSIMVNMDSGASRENHIGYHKDVFTQDVSVKTIGMNNRPLQDQMKKHQQAKDVHSTHLSTVS